MVSSKINDIHDKNFIAFYPNKLGFEVECNAVVCRQLREPQFLRIGSQYEPNMVDCGL